MKSLQEGSETWRVACAVLRSVVDSTGGEATQGSAMDEASVEGRDGHSWGSWTNKEVVVHHSESLEDGDDNALAEEELVEDPEHPRGAMDDEPW